MTEHDEEVRYCRMLGHEVPFSYCRKPGKEQFCRHIVNCWFEKFDIQAYLAEHFTEEQIQAAITPPAPKVESLLSLIERAKGRRGGEPGNDVVRESRSVSGR